MSNLACIVDGINHRILEIIGIIIYIIGIKFLDLTKAFEAVNHKTVFLLKLEKSGN